MNVCVGEGGGEEQQGHKAGSSAAVYTAMVAWVFNIVQHMVTAVGHDQADTSLLQCTNASDSSAL